MDELAIGFLVLGAFVLAAGFMSIPIERWPFLSQPVAALLLGCLLGPEVLDVLAPERWSPAPDHILEVAAELTMGIALMGVALRLPPGYVASNKRYLLVVLGLVMPLMWLSAGLVVHLLLGLPLWTALLAGAVITPTDPVLATTVVHGKMAEENLPVRLRRAISAEAGANDGLAYPLVFLALLALEHGAAGAVTEWLLTSVLRETLGALLLGVVAGHGAGRLLMLAEEKKTMEKSSILACTLALTLFVLGLGAVLGVNGILAVFVAGLAFDRAVDAEDRTREEKVQESINQFFTAPIFILFGLYVPWRDWAALGWLAPALVVAILLLRRLPALLLVYRLTDAIRGVREAAFAGWFGPIGVAAIYYALQARAHTGTDEVWTIGSLVVFASVVAHGLTAAPLTRWLARAERAGADRG